MTHRLWYSPQGLSGATITLMGELELVARVDNRLLLRDATGAEYRLPICPKLKSAVYSAQATPQYATVTGQTEAVSPASGASELKAVEGKHTKLSMIKSALDEPQPRLRPAELQIRLRAGDTPEQLAQFSELTADQIAKFARPIEAERAEIIRAMRRTSLVGANGSSNGTVGELVTQRLSARGITSEQITWFARREIGAPWLIELKFEDVGRTHKARWTFEASRNQLTALDDEARWLSSPDTPVTETVPISLHQGKRSTPTRGSRVVEAAATAFDQADGPQVSGAPIPLSPRVAKPEVDNNGQAATSGRPDLRPVADLQAEVPKAESASAATAEEVAGIVPISRWQAGKLETVALPVLPDEVTAKTPVAAKPATSPKAPVAAKPAAAGIPTGAVRPAGAGGPTGAGAPATAEKPVAARNTMADALKAAPERPANKNGRAKIPSWDEIVFGGKE